VGEDIDAFDRRYYCVGTKWLISVDGRFVNLCTETAYKNFRFAFPTLQSEQWYHVIKWYDEVVNYCSLYGIFVPSYVNVVKNSSSKYGFTCGHSPTDSAPDFVASHLHTWSQVIFLGIAHQGFKFLPANSHLRSLLLNNHLEGLRLLHHILQQYHPLYSVKARDYIVDRPKQKFYDGATGRTVKLTLQEYYDKHQCYYMLDSFLNNSTRSLLDLDELRIFITRCINGFELFHATRNDRENVDTLYRYNPNNLVQTLLQESATLLSRRPASSFDRSYEHSRRPAPRPDRFSDASRRPDSRTSNTRRRSFGYVPPAVEDVDKEFLTKVINAVKVDTQLGLVPACICCRALGLPVELQKHYFADCEYLKNNEFCQQAFKNLCGVLNGLSKKVPVSDSNSKSLRSLALHRLDMILSSPDQQLDEELEEDDIESDDDASTGSNPDLPGLSH